MGANPVSVTICVLTFSSTMLFTASALAIPAKSASQHTHFVPGVSPPNIDAPSDVNDKISPDQAVETTNTALPTSDLQINSPAPAPLQASGPRAGIPCLHDFLSKTPLLESTEQSACDTPADRQQRLSIRFGSRIGPGSSMLGELDGIQVDYRLMRGLTVNGVVGYPVVSSKDKFNATRQMVGINAVTDKFAQAWDLNSYLIEQQHNGQLTNRSVGGALRYLQPKRSLLIFLDYDVYQDSLGAFMTSGAWKLPYRTTLSATLDIRNSPIRKQQQKYLKNTMTNNDGWYWILPDKRIKHFTKNRSNEVATLALGLSHDISHRLKLSGDVAMMDVSTSATSAGSATASLNEYFYHLKLTGSDMMFAGDKNVLDFHHQVSDSLKVSTASLNSKYAINRAWHISPRLRADYRDNTPENSIQWVTSPSLEMEYRWRKAYGLKIQAGGEWSSKEDTDGFESRSSYFMSLGYKANF